jgi:lipopolysaccharide export system protein LptA
VQYRHIRLTRVVVAVGIVAILSVTIWNYVRHFHQLEASKQVVPNIVPSNAENATVGFHYSKIESGQTVYSIKAWRNLGMKDNKNILEDVEILVYGRGGDRYDRIHSARADYDQDSGTVQFEGDVTMLLSSKNQEAEASRLSDTDPRKELLNKTQIKTSKVTYSQRTNRVDTPAPVQFTFNDLSGSAVGMHYDASTDQLSLERDVRVRLDHGEGSTPIEVASGTLLYVKNAGEITLGSGVQIRRDNNTLDAQEVVVHLDASNLMESAEAHGNPTLKSNSPTSQLELTATLMTARMMDGGKQLDSIVANINVHGISRSINSVSEMTAQRLTAYFVGPQNAMQQIIGETEVVLKILPPHNAGTGLQGKPASPQTEFSLNQSSEEKILRSPRVEMTMRPGGRDFDRMICPVPSILELLPVVESQDRKVVRGDRFEATFAGARNTLDTFHANGHVAVDLEPQAPQPSSTHRKTESDVLLAHFDISTGLLTTIDQSGNFHFQETEIARAGSSAGKAPIHQALASWAHYVVANKVTTLEGQPQVWDASSKTTARSITLDEQADTTTATGSVLTVYQNKKSSPAPVARPETPVLVSAERLVGHPKGKTAVYAGNARMWQGDDVVKANEIFLDQNTKTLRATHHVISTFLSDGAGKGGKKDFVSVTADILRYDDTRRWAQYERDVVMKGEMGTLRAPFLDIYLVDKPEAGQSRIDHAVAHGGVTIVQPQRRASSDRAEYFSREDKVILTGNHPTIVDEEKGTSTGRELTFFVRDDRILVDGDPQSRATSQHRVARQ